MGIAEAFILGTAVLFTIVGYRFGKQENDKLIEATVDHLIDNGYIRTKMIDGETQLLKIHEID